MKLRFLVLVSLVALLDQCSQSTGPFAERASPGNSQPHSESDKDNCDYSSFKSFKVGMMQAPGINLPKPVYPSEAKAKNIAGRVVVKVLINAKSGEVERACIVEGNDILGNAAKNAALHATFSPYWGNNKNLAERYKYFEATLNYNFIPQ
jgi:TonB family protein